MSTWDKTKLYLYLVLYFWWAANVLLSGYFLSKDSKACVHAISGQRVCVGVGLCVYVFIDLINLRKLHKCASLRHVRNNCLCADGVAF